MHIEQSITSDPEVAERLRSVAGPTLSAISASSAQRLKAKSKETRRAAFLSENKKIDFLMRTKSLTALTGFEVSALLSGIC